MNIQIVGIQIVFILSFINIKRFIMSMENKNIILGMELLISQNTEILGWCRTLLAINSRILSHLSEEDFHEIHEDYYNNVHFDAWMNEKDIAADMFNSLKYKFEEKAFKEIGEYEMSTVHINE